MFPEYLSYFLLLSVTCHKSVAVNNFLKPDFFPTFSISLNRRIHGDCSSKYFSLFYLNNSIKSLQFNFVLEQIFQLNRTTCFANDRQLMDYYVQSGNNNHNDNSHFVVLWDHGWTSLVMM